MEKFTHKPKEPSIESVGDLDTAKRKKLRNTLKGLTLGAGVTLAAWTGDDESTDTEDADFVEPSSISEPEERKIAETPIEEKEEKITPAAESFHHPEFETYKIAHTLKWDEVRFIDAQGQPVGDPVKLENFIAEYPEGKAVPTDAAGNQLANKYEYTISRETNDIGTPLEGISDEWADARIRELSELYPDTHIVGKVHVTQDFIAAYNDSDEPVLRQAVENREVETVYDIFEYYSEQPVEPDSDISRLEYLRHGVVFPEYPKDHIRHIPTEIQNELIRLMPGLMAHESKGNVDVTSGSGARGALQYMPNVWEIDHGGTDENAYDFKLQVDELGKRWAQVMGEIRDVFKVESLASIRELYGTEEEFNLKFLTPLMIASYNAGAARMVAAVEKYISEVGLNPDARDGLIIAILDYSEQVEGNGIGMHVRGYTPSVYAWMETIEEQEKKKDQLGSYDIVQNDS